MRRTLLATMVALPLLISTASASTYLYNSDTSSSGANTTSKPYGITRCAMTTYFPNEWDVDSGNNGKTPGLNPFCTLSGVNTGWQTLTAVYSNTSSGGQSFGSASQTVQNWATGPAYSFSGVPGTNGWLYSASSLTDDKVNTYSPNGTLTAGAKLGLGGTAGTLLFNDYGHLVSHVTSSNGSVFGWKDTFSYFPFQILSSSSVTSSYTIAQAPQQTIFETTGSSPAPVSTAQFPLPVVPASIVVVRKGGTTPMSFELGAMQSALKNATYTNFIWANYDSTSKTSGLSNDANNPINTFLSSSKCWGVGGPANGSPLVTFVLLWNNWTNAPKDWCMLYNPSSYYAAGSGTSSLLPTQLNNLASYLVNTSVTAAPPVVSSAAVASAKPTIMLASPSVNARTNISTPAPADNSWGAYLKSWISIDAWKNYFSAKIW